MSTQASQYAVAQRLGFDAFQGSFFSSPEPVPATDMPQSTVAAMRLLGLARDPNVNDRKLEEVLETDPILTFQLLRLVNFGRSGHARGELDRPGPAPHRPHHVPALAGGRRGREHASRPPVSTRSWCARRCSAVACSSNSGGGPRDAGTLFLVGLFSQLDAVFRMSIPEILERVVLSDEANAALLDRTGPVCGRAVVRRVVRDGDVRECGGAGPRHGHRSGARRRAVHERAAVDG